MERINQIDHFIWISHIRQEQQKRNPKHGTTPNTNNKTTSIKNVIKNVTHFDIHLQKEAAAALLLVLINQQWPTLIN